MAALYVLRSVCLALGFEFVQAWGNYEIYAVESVVSLDKCGLIRSMIFVNVLLYSLFLQGPDHQTILFNHGAVQNIAHLLTSPSYKVR